MMHLQSLRSKKNDWDDLCKKQAQVQLPYIQWWMAHDMDPPTPWGQVASSQRSPNGMQKRLNNSRSVISVGSSSFKGGASGSGSWDDTKWWGHFEYEYRDGYVRPKGDLIFEHGSLFQDTYLITQTHTYIYIYICICIYIYLSIYLSICETSAMRPISVVWQRWPWNLQMREDSAWDISRTGAIECHDWTKPS